MTTDQIIQDVLAAAARDDRAALPPASYELRDGQIYRWTDR
jgi:hypothetical protein